MRKAIMLSAVLIVMSALPAFADGYKDAPPPNRGPSVLAPHAQEARAAHENVRVVYVERDTAPVRYTSSACGCCCAPVSYTHTYTTEPVVVRHYRRSYTRMAAPDCNTAAAHHGDVHHSHYRKHHEERYYREGRYDEGRREHDEWRRETRYDGYDGPYSDGPVYRENTVIWSSDGRYRDRTDYTARRDEYSYYQARHD